MDLTASQYARIVAALKAGLSCARSLHCEAARRDRELIEAVLAELTANEKEDSK